MGTCSSSASSAAQPTSSLAGTLPKLNFTKSEAKNGVIELRAGQTKKQAYAKRSPRRHVDKKSRYATVTDNTTNKSAGSAHPFTVSSDYNVENQAADEHTEDNNEEEYTNEYDDNSPLASPLASKSREDEGELSDAAEEYIAKNRNSKNHSDFIRPKYAHNRPYHSTNHPRGVAKMSRQKKYQIHSNNNSSNAENTPQPITVDCSGQKTPSNHTTVRAWHDPAQFNSTPTPTTQHRNLTIHGSYNFSTNTSAIIHSSNGSQRLYKESDILTDQALAHCASSFNATHPILICNLPSAQINNNNSTNSGSNGANAAAQANISAVPRSQTNFTGKLHKSAAGQQQNSLPLPNSPATALSHNNSASFIPHFVQNLPTSTKEHLTRQPSLSFSALSHSHALLSSQTKKSVKLENTINLNNSIKTNDSGNLIVNPLLGTLTPPTSHSPAQSVVKSALRSAPNAPKESKSVALSPKTKPKSNNFEVSHSLHSSLTEYTELTLQNAAQSRTFAPYLAENNTKHYYIEGSVSLSTSLAAFDAISDPKSRSRRSKTIKSRSRVPPNFPNNELNQIIPAHDPSADEFWE
jgi:hypothetical protein